MVAMRKPLEVCQRVSKRPILAWFVLSTVIYATLLTVDATELDRGFSEGVRDLVSESRSLFTNIFASFILYYLVVFLPSRRRHRVLQAGCEKMYAGLKREILFEILSCAWKGGNKDVDLAEVDELMNPVKFRDFFDGGREADEGFYAFSNHIQRNEGDFKLIVSKFKSVARQIDFILNNMEIEDEQKFQRLKRIEHALLSLDELHANYDDVKTLDRMIWEIFGGFSSIDGYRNFDPIQKAISEL